MNAVHRVRHTYRRPTRLSLSHHPCFLPKWPSFLQYHRLSSSCQTLPPPKSIPIHPGHYLALGRRCRWNSSRKILAHLMNWCMMRWKQRAAVCRAERRAEGWRRITRTLTPLMVFPESNEYCFVHGRMVQKVRENISAPTAIAEAPRSACCSVARVFKKL